MVAIGLDIGGTNIRAGIVSEKGTKIGTFRSIPTCAHSPRETIISNIVELIRSVCNQVDADEIAGIGIGCTGPLDNENGIILDVANLPTLKYFNLKEAITKNFNTRFVLDNDANTYILGEAIYGAGKDAEAVLGFTLGTGLGSAFVLSKQIWQGVTGCAGEIWTSPYKDGIIEDYVSGTAISKNYKLLTGEDLPAIEIAELARKENQAALQVWKNFSTDLAFALSWSVNMMDPNVIILGGSLAKSADLYLDKVDRLFRKHICLPLVDIVSLKLASLGDDAGVIGAAINLFNSI